MNGTILVIDDEKLIRWSIKERLKDEGYHVVEAENCRKAEEQFTKATFDVILCDLKLPDGDGISLMKKLRGISDTTQFIIITAHASVENAVEAMKLGARDYISKPFNMDEIALKVARAMEAISMKSQIEYLTKESRGIDIYGKIVANSGKMKDVLDLVTKVSMSEAKSILLTGESGVGKDLIARIIHNDSKRTSKSFVNITCTAIPETLLESELFGHERGAFTDAREQKKGLVEVADRGTLYLDEIGDMPLMLQSKLLRFLEEKKFRRIGGTFDIGVDVRIIAATNKDIPKLAEEGKFREDLFYRLGVIIINIPPLRERKEDIPYITRHFIEVFNRSLKKNVKNIASEAMQELKGNEWKGNVRELRNVIERAMLLLEGDTINKTDIVFTPVSSYSISNNSNSGAAFKLPSSGISMEELEKEMIRQALENSSGNQSKAARLLSISRDQLRYKANKFNIGMSKR